MNYKSIDILLKKLYFKLTYFNENNTMIFPEKKRFLPIDEIPDSLWDRDEQLLKLPAELIDSWEEILDDENLRELALEDYDDGSTGGEDKLETDTHLAKRYTGSCARTILSILDPLDKVDLASDAYVSIFAGGDVFLLDIPSGSGSGSISILTTLYELRKKQVLPRCPLNIRILAGEISSSARDYFSRQIIKLSPLLKAQAINVEFKITEWDVINKQSNLDFLVKMYDDGKNMPSKLILITNFSGFLGINNNWNTAKENFESLFYVNRDEHSYVIWIEPQIKAAGKIIPKIAGWVIEKFSKLMSKIKSEDELHCHTDINCAHPLKEKQFKTRMKILCFGLTHRNEK